MMSFSISTLQFAKNDGSKVVRHSTVAAIGRSPYAPY